jgi:hypothetical protein
MNKEQMARVVSNALPHSVAERSGWLVQKPKIGQFGVDAAADTGRPEQPLGR